MWKWTRQAVRELLNADKATLNLPEAGQEFGSGLAALPILS